MNNFITTYSVNYYSQFYINCTENVEINYVYE